MKQKVAILVATIAFALIGVGCWLCMPYCSENKAAKLRAIENAHIECEKALEARANELEAWYLADKTRTEAMAAELNSLKGKWIMAKTTVSGNEKERKDFFQSVSKEYLHSSQDCEKQTAMVVAELLRDWTDVEDKLAIELACPKLGHTQTDEKVQTGEHIVVDHTSTLQKQITADIASFIGGEVVTCGVTALGVSAGVLGTGAVLSAETFGISLVVGVAVDLGVNWYMDTEGTIKKALDEKIEEAAKVKKQKFHSVMQKSLDELIIQWKQQLL